MNLKKLSSSIKRNINKEEKIKQGLLLSFLSLFLILGVSCLNTQKIYATGDIEINETNFPDENFRNHLKPMKNSNKYDKDENGKLSQNEIEAIKALDVNFEEITTLKGIEYFTFLEQLECQGNKLSELDLSNNTALKTLNCQENKNLSELDLSKNLELKTLDCQENKNLSKLKLSPALEYLSCYNGNLSELDLSNNTALKTLDCHNNKISKLNLSGNFVLYDLKCSDNQLDELDLSKNIALKALNCSNNRLTILDLGENYALKYLECTSNMLSKLDTSKNTALKTLSCNNNQLNELNLSKNTALTLLECDENQLSKLDLSPSLEEISCSNSELSELDLSKCTVLEKITCNDNKLSELKLSLSLEEVSCNNNQLSELDLSKSSALTQLSCDNNKLSQLDLSNSIYLGSLKCSDNQLSKLDISKNDVLIELVCYNNQLNTLDLSKNPQLTRLECYNNKLDKLDLSKNLDLQYLDCHNNQLVTLDISNNTNLNALYCSENKILYGIKLGSKQLKLGFDGKNQNVNVKLDDRLSINIPDHVDKSSITNLQGGVIKGDKIEITDPSIKKITYDYKIGIYKLNVTLNLIYPNIINKVDDLAKRKEEAKKEIEELSKLDNQEKKDFINKINDKTTETIEKVNDIVVEARKRNNAKQDFNLLRQRRKYNHYRIGIDWRKSSEPAKDIKTREKKETKIQYEFIIGKKEYVKIIGDLRTIKKMEVAPYIENDRIMLPLRYLAESIEAKVEWNEVTRVASFIKDGIRADYQIDGTIVKLSDGRNINIGMMKNIENRILIPLTKISEIFNLTNGNLDDEINQDIEWEQVNQKVVIRVKSFQ